ncbi:hypothetical protein BJP36_37905 [Moorena producens JHB]|uniref:Uncharacterized protein n=1 Tax=Moorena producens (strain JHB) TaxID=1454205 RepID=A0A9Q9SUI8_MOOP1|nr:hypothetical protein [Moorena producens]WAN69870.1 hypothetical protein BJP36_37905 [Moorena producens JHB]
MKSQTFNLGLWPRYANNLGLWPRYANNLGLWPRYANNLGLWPRYANNLDNLQPSTLITYPTGTPKANNLDHLISIKPDLTL